MSNEELVKELGIESLSEQEQQRALDELSLQVGQALMGGMGEDQVAEYEAIINGNQDVITSWLETNDPRYKESIAYVQLAEGFDDDPDKVPADKMYASVAWLKKNNPDLDEKVAAIKAKLKAEFASS